MNRKFLPFLMLAFGVITASAQPTLTSTSIPLVGDRDVQFATDTFTAGAGGAALTWNYDTLHNNGADTFAWDACSVSPRCATFPGTTIYAHVLGATAIAEVYFHMTPTAYSEDGQYSTGAVPYSNYEDLLRFPFTYLNTYTDTLAATFTSGSSFYRSGTITVTADAYGTLILPTATFTNALRIHRVENYQDSIIGTAVFGHYHSDIYLWYAPSIRTELLAESQTSINGVMGPKRAYYSNKQPVATAVNKSMAIQESLQLYPNPVKDELNIQFTNLENTALTVTLTDMLGRDVAAIANGDFSAGDHKITYQTSALQKGLYLVRLQSSTEIITRKVEIL